ncbi:hypothetical protein [Albimonas pacifica]|uniref:hypothetical protein n=1 Tax=Albimonas pacifica TaxID=1114924 RepID=UPI000B8654B7|nr:hypothetical protein [Albimonas pacifica]
MDRRFAAASAEHPAALVGLRATGRRRPMRSDGFAAQSGDGKPFLRRELRGALGARRELVGVSPIFAPPGALVVARARCRVEVAGPGGDGRGRRGRRASPKRSESAGPVAGR